MAVVRYYKKLLVFCVAITLSFVLIVLKTKFGKIIRLKLHGELYYKIILQEVDLADDWMKRKTFCNGNFIVYGQEFAYMKNAVFFPNYSKGIFSIRDLPNYSEGRFTIRDFPNYSEGRFSVRDCDIHFKHDELVFKETTNENHLNRWIYSLVHHTSRNTTPLQISVHSKPTLAVFRYEYANFYHQLTDIYNAFIVMRLLGIRHNDLNILIVDKNVPFTLDSMWGILFKNVTFARAMASPVLYSELIWGVLGYNSPINFHSLKSLPYVNEFSNFIKTRYSASSTRELDCSRVSILFIWRRNYISHANNKKGIISRKIKNEEELIKSVKSTFPGHQINGVQLDKISMAAQIQLVSQTDILVGMHGAGMSHVMFLPPHGGVLELYPTYWSKMSQHFKAMARWRGLHYLNWQNINPNNECDGLFTYIPRLVVTLRLKTLFKEMCGRGLVK